MSVSYEQNHFLILRSVFQLINFLAGFCYSRKRSEFCKALIQSSDGTSADFAYPDVKTLFCHGSFSHFVASQSLWAVR